MLDVKDLTVSYGSHFSLSNLTFRLEEGDWLMVVGPNGAGKSTLVDCLSGKLDYQGQIYYHGRKLSSLTAKEKARVIGILRQKNEVLFDFKVEDLVGLGRYAYGQGLIPHMTAEDQAAIDQALDLTGLAAYRHRSVMTLSGGEQQRSFLAQVLAQDPQLLVLDEPANHLDLAYQESVFQLIEEWVQEEGRAVLSIVHDLTTAKRYGKSAILLKNGTMHGAGPLSEVLTPQQLNEVYQMDVYGSMKKRAAVWLDEEE